MQVAPVSAATMIPGEMSLSSTARHFHAAASAAPLAGAARGLPVLRGGARGGTMARRAVRCQSGATGPQPIYQLAAKKGRPQGRQNYSPPAQSVPAKTAQKSMLPAQLQGVVPETIGPVPTVFAAPVALLLVVGAIAKATQRKGSVGQLVDRGMLDEYREVDDKFYKGMMKNVNTAPTPELTEDQILEARKRRAAERLLSKDDLLDEIDLPDNHPFAVKENVTEDDEKVIQDRLNVRSRRDNVGFDD